MTLIYRFALLATMYAGLTWLVLRFAFPRHYRLIAAWYRRFEQRVSEADDTAFIRRADLLSQLGFVLTVTALAGLLLTGLAAHTMQLAR